MRWLEYWNRRVTLVAISLSKERLNIMMHVHLLNPVRARDLINYLAMKSLAFSSASRVKAIKVPETESTTSVTMTGTILLSFHA